MSVEVSKETEFLSACAALNAVHQAAENLRGWLECTGLVSTEGDVPNSCDPEGSYDLVVDKQRLAGLSATKLALEDALVSDTFEGANKHQETLWSALTRLEPRNFGDTLYLRDSTIREAWETLDEGIDFLESDRDDAARDVFGPWGGYFFSMGVDNMPDEFLRQPHIKFPTPASARKERKLQAAYDFIAEKGPVKGLLVARSIRIKPPAFRKYYVPLLKNRGVKNDGDGYYLQRAR